MTRTLALLIVRDVLDALGLEHPEPMRLRAVVDEAHAKYVPDATGTDPGESAPTIDEWRAAAGAHPMTRKG